MLQNARGHDGFLYSLLISVLLFCLACALPISK